MKNIVIIGASSGIGNRLAQSELARGNKVFGTYNKTNSSNDGLVLHQLDVLAEQPDISFVPEIVDGLVYCPGTVLLKPFARFKPDDFVSDYMLQVVGAVKVIQALIPKLKNSEMPSVVLFSTVAVQMGFNFHSLVSSSKGAIEGLTRALAAEFAPKIRVNCIAPSITDTPLASGFLNTQEKREANAQRHPLKKIGTSEQIATVAEFLLSENSNWITGQVIHVDGGMSAIK